jgi:hypothetical protein
MGLTIEATPLINEMKHVFYLKIPSLHEFDEPFVFPSQVQHLFLE